MGVGKAAQARETGGKVCQLQDLRVQGAGSGGVWVSEGSGSWLPDILFSLLML